MPGRARAASSSSRGLAARPSTGGMIHSPRDARVRARSARRWGAAAAREWLRATPRGRARAARFRARRSSGSRGQLDAVARHRVVTLSGSGVRSERAAPSETEQAVAEAAPLDATRAPRPARRAAAAPARPTRCSPSCAAAACCRCSSCTSSATGRRTATSSWSAISQVTGGLVAVNPNTMYPLLRSLEGRGLVAGEWEHPERRSRRFYRLTDGGRGRARPPARRDRAVPRRGRALGRPHPHRGPARLMGRAKAQIDLPVQVSAAEALWYDLDALAGVRRRLRPRGQARGRLAARGRARWCGTRCPTAAAGSSRRVDALRGPRRARPSRSRTRRSPARRSSRSRRCGDGRSRMALELDCQLKDRERRDARSSTCSSSAARSPTRCAARSSRFRRELRVDARAVRDGL